MGLEFLQRLKEYKCDIDDLIYRLNNTCIENSYIINLLSTTDGRNLNDELKNMCSTLESLSIQMSEITEFSSAPYTIHQTLIILLCDALFQYRRKHNIRFRILIAPIKVVFAEKEKYFEPDIIIVFDEKKIKRDGCYGAPDIIIEVASKSTRKNDYTEKNKYYLLNGVKEYVIVDPIKECITSFENGKDCIVKSFNEDVVLNCIPKFTFNIHKMLLKECGEIIL